MKRKHPEHEQRRITRKPYRERSGGWRAHDRMDPVSPTESQDGPYNEHLSSEGSPGMDSEIWQTALRYAQQQIHQENTGGTDLRGRGGRTQNSYHLPQQQSMNGLNGPGNTLQDAVDMERSILAGAFSFNPAQDLDTQLQQTIQESASFDANMTGFNFFQNLPENLLLTVDSPRPQDDWLPSSLQLTRGCELFFAHVSHFIPFLHHPTFDIAQAPPLLALSMLSLGYQYCEDPECGDQEGSGVALSTRCFHRARGLVLFSSDEGPADAIIDNVVAVQSHLLLQICAMLYMCGDSSGYGLKIHSNMISLVRAGGLMAPACNASTMTEDLDSLWREFIKTETQKRTAFAVHQIDALWYQVLSIPRSISHLEIKHDLPCPEEYWKASSSVEWAHRKLVARDSGHSPVQYTDAVRRFLSPETDLPSMPRFDPYGAINITQFLVSSAREISGWSAMTGMLSMDRFSALRSSLITLNHFICPERESEKSPRTSTAHSTAMSHTAEATWQIAMIELHMWSPSHTGGIVEASIDAVLTQLTTYLVPSYGILEPATASAIQPHVDWFLHYLETTLTPDAEAPWIAFYAYKAFLIAWQGMCGRVAGAMQVVGIGNGDVQGALGWARKVFGRRRRWQLGKVIISRLDELEK